MGVLMSANYSDLWLLVGWTMVHFLWLGTLVGLAALASRWLLRRASANIRYAVAVSCLLLLTVLPAAIASWFAINSQYLPVRAGERAEHIATVLSPAMRNAAPAPRPNDVVELHRPHADRPASALAAAPTPAVVAPPATEGSAAASRLLDESSLVALVDKCIPYLPWFWIIGTPITFAITATGLIGTRRLRSASRAISEGPIADTLARLVNSLGVTQHVAIAICERIAAPVLIGVLRPLILLPPAALSGYSPDEIEMVLLHELAHVRRWDNLVNLIQRLIESLLFFHPAVWLISSWVRREREACCDSVVVARTDHPHAYAELLVALAAQMPRSVLFHPAASSAMAAGPLRNRIRRILQLDDDPMLVSGKSIATLLAALMLTAALAILYAPRIGQAESSTAQSIESGKGENQVRAAEIERTRDNLKSIGIALQQYSAKYRSLPPQAHCSVGGTPRYSWRVLLLPFLGEEKLFHEFHLDEPWDSDHNRELIVRMPDVFKSPKSNQPGKTNYLAVVGKECVFDGTPKGISLKSVTDGTSNTIAIVEANADQAVDWTKPDDWKFDRAQPTRGLGQLWPGFWYGLFVDGSVLRFEDRDPADKIGIYFTRNGGESHSLAESANQQLPGAATQGVGGPAAGSADSAGEKMKVDVPGRSDDSDILVLAARLNDAGGIEVFANDKRVNKEELAALIPKDPERRKNLATSLAVDKKINYSDAMNLVDLLESLGIEKLALDTRADLDRMPASSHAGGKAPKQSGPAPAVEPRVIATLADDWQNVGTKGYQEFYKGVTDIQKQNLRPDLVRRDGKFLLVAIPQPKQANWPAMLGDWPRKDRVIAEKAWRQLGLKLVPLTAAETFYRQSTGLPTVVLIVGGNVPIGLPLPSELVKLNGNSIENMDALLAWLGEGGRTFEGVKCSAAADGHDYLFESRPADNAPPATSAESPSDLAQTKPTPHHFPSLEDQKLADLAWKRLQLEIEPISPEYLKRVKSLGYDGGVVVADVAKHSGETPAFNEIQVGDILVGLHVWPVKSLQDVATVLKRDDIAELSPLKFYAVRPGNGADNAEISGRISVSESQPATYPTAPKSEPTLNSSSAPAGNPFSSTTDAREYEVGPQSSQLVRSPREPSPASLPYIPQVAFENRPSTTALPSTPSAHPVPAIAPARPAPAAAAAPTIASATDDWQPKPSDVNGPNSLRSALVPSSQIPAVSRPATKSLLQDHESQPTLATPINRTPDSDAHAVKRDTSSSDKPKEVISPTLEKADAKHTAAKSEPVTNVLRADTIVIHTPEQVKIGALTRSGSRDATVELQTTPKAVPPTPALESTASKPADDPVTIVAHEIPKDLAEDVGRYTDRIRGRIRTSWDDRGRLIMQAPRSRHEDLENLLKFTSQWRASDAAKDPNTGSINIHKVDGEDVLEWPATGLTFIRDKSGKPTPRGIGGVCVGSVVPGSPAAWFDVRPGDIVSQVGSFEVGSVADLASIIKTLREGYRTERKLGVSFYRETPREGGAWVQADFPLKPAVVDPDVETAKSRYRRAARADRAKQESKTDESPASAAKGKDPFENGNNRTGSASADKSKLNYDGKSFDEWCTAWRAELSTAKRIEAAKAMAAFGAHGYGPEAARQVLDIVHESGFKRNLIGGSPEANLRDELCSSLDNQIPVGDWLPLLHARYAADPGAWQDFALEALRLCYTPDEKQRDDIQRFLLEIANRPDVQVSRGAVNALAARYPANAELKKILLSKLKGDSPFEALNLYTFVGEFPPDLVEILLHGEPKQQATFRAFVGKLGGPAPTALAATLIDVVKDEKRGEDRVAAIRALGAMRPLNTETTDKVRDVLNPLVDHGPQDQQIATAVALPNIVGNGDGDALMRLRGKLVDTAGKPLGIEEIQSLIKAEKKTVSGGQR